VRRETLLTELHQRVRDFAEGPDGLIYVLTDGNENAVLRIEPGAAALRRSVRRRPTARAACRRRCRRTAAPVPIGKAWLTIRVAGRASATRRGQQPRVDVPRR
jgi:hypothetical protein